MRRTPTKAKPGRRSFHGPTPVLIENADDLAAGVRLLIRSCPDMRRAQRLTGPLPLRRTQAGFAALAEIVVGQMLSTASAEAIWTRVERLARPFTAATVLNLADAELLGAGLSVGKLKTLRALATAVSTGGLDPDAVHTPGIFVKRLVQGPFYEKRIEKRVTRE